MRSRHYAALVVVMFTGARAILAQQARGVVRDSVSQRPLAGAVVTVVDSSGATGARTIADGTGRFAVGLTRTSMRLHVIRIGYQPRDVPLAHSSADISIAFSMLRIPVLDAVQVASSELCPGSADRGTAFQLWEQARAGLLASVVAREAKPATVTMLTFRRNVSPEDELIHDGITETHKSRTARPFMSSAPPAAFAAVGYVTEESDGGRTYNAPDADVLLDESFAATHCFRLKGADKTHPEQIGLAFAPIGGRDTLADVNGVVWMDRATPALRTLEYRYTGLEPAAEKANAGGYVEFRSMSNGVTFIDYWVLRLPVMSFSQRVTSSARSGFNRNASEPARRRQDRTEFRLTDISEAGGAVLDATWDDGTQWQADPTSLTGTVFQKGSTAPVPYAFLTLVGTSDTATADAAGRFIFPPLVPGKYSMAAVDTALRGYVPPRRETKTVEVKRGQITVVRAELSPLASVLTDACRGERVAPNTVTIVGRVARADGASFEPGFTMASSWLAEVTKRGDQFSGMVRDQQSTVDSEGRFVVCGVAPDHRVTLKLRQGSLVLRDTTVYTGTAPIARVEWKWLPKPE